MLAFRPRKTTTRIIIHGGHEDVPEDNPVPLLRVRGREMGLLEIGYHYIILPNGNSWGCREPHLMGSHTPGNNHDSVGIYLSGRSLPAMQVYQLWSFKNLLEQQYGPLPIVGKSEVIRYRNRPTGPFFDMDELRAKLAGINP